MHMFAEYTVKARMSDELWNDMPDAEMESLACILDDAIAAAIQNVQAQFLTLKFEVDF